VTRDHALDIISAYGGDASRWPASEGAAVLALADSDAVVAQALMAARQLDTLLDGWARDVTPATIDIAAITGQAAGKRAATVVPPAARRWLAGGLAAAAMAAGLAFMAPVTPVADAGIEIVSTPAAVQLVTAQGDTFGSDAIAFATVFTPTADEDVLI
jgi:hypothetical protein